MLVDEEISYLPAKPPSKQWHNWLFMCMSIVKKSIENEVENKLVETLIRQREEWIEIYNKGYCYNSAHCII